MWKAATVLLALVDSVNGDSKPLRGLPDNRVCPPKLKFGGSKAFSEFSLIPTGWNTASGGERVIVSDNRTKVAPRLGSRAYFGDSCTAGQYSNEDYLALKLLNKKITYTVSMKDVGCGCNLAFYLVEMKPNTDKSSCGDYYCDANSVCGVACSEIDIMEANGHSFHATLHTKSDHEGMAGGFGGGDGWNGPRDWTKEQYAPGGNCIDTNKPFEVAVSFPTDKGELVAMEVVLTQQRPEGPCFVKTHLSEYAGMPALTESLARGMTPVVSYWSSDKMLWLDGAGADHKGECWKDDQVCPNTAELSDFRVEWLKGKAGESAGGTAGGAGHEKEEDFELPTMAPVKEATCPGELHVKGEMGKVQMVPTGWGLADQAPVMVENGSLTTTMGSRVYFADTCSAGSYSNLHYQALKLLGKTLHYTVDLSAADCGCNSALYLVSMHQNEDESSCDDYYCDANSVCGVACSEIDIQEANIHAWHSTLHSEHDHDGLAAGLGGGDGWNGPRDFNKEHYGPGSSCIDSTKPIDVAASFPVNTETDQLSGFHVKLSQPSNSNCTIKMVIKNYEGIYKLHRALEDGMTIVASYWADDKMLWLDGQGEDKRGYCAQDVPSKCGDKVAFWNFSVTTDERNLPTDPGLLKEGICLNGFLLNPKCTMSFKYNNELIEGCTNTDDKGQFWCSHDFEYVNNWSPCEPCLMDIVGDHPEKTFDDEEIVEPEDIHGDPEPQKPSIPQLDIAQPWMSCGDGKRQTKVCSEGFVCVRHEGWFQCAQQTCYLGWKLASGCVMEFEMDDTHYVGCTTADYNERGWCSSDAQFNGHWLNCTRCDEGEHDVMQANEELLRRPVVAHSPSAFTMLVVPLLSIAFIAGAAMAWNRRHIAQGSRSFFWISTPEDHSNDGESDLRRLLQAGDRNA